MELTYICSEVIQVPDYKKMYFKLYRAHSKVIAILNLTTLETEEVAMDTKDPVTLPVVSEEGAGDNEDKSI